MNNLSPLIPPVHKADQTHIPLIDRLNVLRKGLFKGNFTKEKVNTVGVTKISKILDNCNENMIK